jgi:hypothetical protein
MINKFKVIFSGKKRVVAFLLAMLMIITAIVPYFYNNIDADAATTVKVTGRNQWTYAGKTRYQWYGSDGIIYFCAEPGVHNSNPGSKTIFTVANPYGNLELHCKVAAVGYCYNNKLVSYRDAQVYVWNGYAGNTIIDAYAAQFLAEQSVTSVGGFTLPQHVYQSPDLARADRAELKLNNGTEYVTEIPLTTEQEDIFSDPSTLFNIEGYTNWTKAIKDHKLVITFPGGTKPVLSSPLRIIPAPLKATQYGLASSSPSVYYVYQKGQDFITGDYKIDRPDFYIDFGTDPEITLIEEGESTSILHEEIFSATYNVDLYKYDYETGETLEGSEWDVLEAFDSSQEGIGDGHNGTVSLELMNPQESSWDGYHSCAVNLRTDADGHIKHTDERSYHYAKTYCTGHEEPEESGDEEADAVAMEEYEAQVAACEENTSFHAIEPGAAQEAMLADRDATYNAFINLKYQYTVQESNARTGYSKHDIHADDARIPVVTIASSESGITQEWAKEYSDNIVSTGIYTPIYKDFTVGPSTSGDDDDEEGGSSEETEYFITDAVVLAISDSGKTIKVDNDGDTLSFDISSANITYGDISKIEVGCYVDVNYKEGSNKHTAIDVYVYGEMAAESANVKGFVKAVSGRKITIEPEDGYSPTKYDYTEAYTTNSIFNNYTSALKPKVGDYILDIEYLTSGNEYKTVTYMEFIPKKFLAEAGIQATAINYDLLLDEEDETEYLESEENETENLEIEDKSTEEKSATRKMVETETDVADDFVFVSEDDFIETETEDDLTDSDSVEDLIATPSDAIMMTYKVEDYDLDTNHDTHPTHIEKNRQKVVVLSDSGENANADITKYSSKESSPAAAPPNSSDTILMTWKVYDHRFEGEIHINKRDLYLSTSEENNENFDAYAIAQGDGTLEGAVYGLFAAEDIVHPDGKTGVVFHANDLVSVATTDRNGDASFMAITEAPGTTIDTNGNIVPSKTTSTNLFNTNDYRDDYKNDNNPGRIYSDNVNQNGNAWIGRPLICGEHSYYIKELSRSEGYELSVSGKDKTHTNLGASDSIDFELSGKAKFNPLPYYNNQVGTGKLDPASVEFNVESLDIKNGYTLTTKNYENGTKFYFITHNFVDEKITVETGSKEVELVDKNGNPVYKTHEAGEVKYDANGNPIYLVRTTTETEVRDNNNVLSVIAGMSAEDSAKYIFMNGSGNITNDPASGVTTVPKIRSNTYLTGTSATVAIDPLKPLGDYSTIHAAAIEILHGKSDGSTIGLGYHLADNDGGFITLTLTGTTNQEFVNQIVNWYVQNPMWNAAEIEDIYLDTDGKYKAILIYDYAEIVNGGMRYYQWVYERSTGDLYYCAKYPVVGRTGIDRGTYRTYVKFNSSEITPIYGLSGNIRAFTIDHMRRIPEDTQLVLGEDYSKYIANEYMRMFDTYVGGEPILDANGNKIQDTEIVPIFEEITIKADYPTYTPIPAVWDSETQSYVMNISKNNIEQYGIDSEDFEGWTKVEFKATAPEKYITVNGLRMAYAEYLENYGDMKLTVNKSQEQIDAENASYVVYKQLPNGTQSIVKIDGDTNEKPVTVQERPIKQQIKVIKDIEVTADGSYKDDTYSAVHKDNLSANQYNNWLDKASDWLANLIGGKEANSDTAHIADFRFKVYLKSNLERLYRDNDGNIVWLDRNGNILTPEYADLDGDGTYDTFVWKDENDKVIDFPEAAKTSDHNELLSSNVQKIYTKVEHETNSKTVGDINNNVWTTYDDPQTGNTELVGEKYGYSTSLFNAEGNAVIINDSLYSYQDKNINVNKTDRINTDQNIGYTRVLESVDEAYNYEKFFDAVHVANIDKWDSDMISGTDNYPGQNWFDTFDDQYQKEDENTSYKPFQWIREKLFGSTFDSASEYPAVHDNINVENKKNTSMFANKNANASNAVRQFAIDWYLKDEAAKLLVNNGYGEDVAKNITVEADGSLTVKQYAGSVDYSEEVYDIALYNAIGKAYNYLKPFFDHDLDTIYSVEVDSETDGGSDHNNTTLSANIEYTSADGGYYYGVSSYLPYGTYVIVEEQPSDIELGDFDNKHYKTDKPKEVSLPIVYESGTTDEFNSYYKYNSTDTPETLIEKYNIRFNEEWATNHTDDLREYVIRSHNNNGDFEIYKYGLDINKTIGNIDYNSGSYFYKGFSVIQELFDPLKDYYNSPLVDTLENGGNEDSHYFSDDENGNKTTANGKGYGDNEIEKRYHYGSISEHAGESDERKTMTGIQTMYDDEYATALVPWSVTEPVSSASYNPDEYKGYADTTFKNIFYTTKLRIEKLDSETGENIVHDGAIFALYAASRYTSQDEVDQAIAEGAPVTTKIGDAKFYTEDTMINGTFEFLKAMGADKITSPKRVHGDNSNRYTGIVPAGTPVCVESEQIILYDEVGAKTGNMSVYTTTNDVNMVNEEDGGKSYHDQNTGYFVTPKPIGAGVYVLVELKAPAGYAGTKPIAIEIYSDEVNYYLNGNIETKVNATIYHEK